MFYRKVLLADDEKRMRKLVGDFLKKAGYEVVEAADGEEAMDLFFEDPKSFDLVILDIMMPKIEGWEVCKEIRGKSNVLIIMLTAKGEERDELLGLHLGADEYITKPFKISNTGQQINKEDMEKIWDSFYKADKARTREYGGSGLGLSIVKAIMQAHNCACGSKNIEDGVEFWFELKSYGV